MPSRASTAPKDNVHDLCRRRIQRCVGRVSVQKNIEAFFRTGSTGSKVVVGSGPALARLQQQYPKALFLRALHGKELASAFSGADVFVFPSRTDTFGLVMIKALACGTPVAAYPVPGPVDILRKGVGAMDPDLGWAITRALECDRNTCAAYARSFSWRESAR